MILQGSSRRGRSIRVISGYFLGPERISELICLLVLLWRVTGLEYLIYVLSIHYPGDC